MKRVTQKEALKEILGIRNSGSGKFIRIRWKTLSGRLTERTVRFGVKKGVKGIGMKYNPADHGLINCYDMQGHFISIVIKNILFYTIDGVTKEVIENSLLEV